MGEKLKQTVAVATATRKPYNEALKTRPGGACYCDLTDEDCYARGHWQAMDKTSNNAKQA